MYSYFINWLSAPVQWCHQVQKPSFIHSPQREPHLMLLHIETHIHTSKRTKKRLSEWRVLINWTFLVIQGFWFGWTRMHLCTVTVYVLCLIYCSTGLWLCAPPGLRGQKCPSWFSQKYFVGGTFRPSFNSCCFVFDIFPRGGCMLVLL